MPNLRGVRNMLFSAIPMDAEALCDRSSSLVDAETGWRLAPVQCSCSLARLGDRRPVPASQRPRPRCYTVGSQGRWPAVLNGSAEPDSTRTTLGGDRGVHARESIRLELPLGDVYRFWRRRKSAVMTHLDRVTEGADGRSHWVTSRPAGLAVEWDAEIINDVENKVLA